jgi:hypothetical protein
MAEISRRAALWTLVAFVLPAFGSEDQPSNVLVGDLTFVRPKNWRWEAPPPASNAESRYVISTIDNQTTDCRFFFTDSNWKNTRELWTKQFWHNGQPLRIREEIEKASEANLRFLTVDGDYAVNSKHAIQTNFRLVGTIIPVGRKTVRTRLVGPIAEVEKATPAFKKMVMDAVKLRRAEN